MINAGPLKKMSVLADFETGRMFKIPEIDGTDA